MGILETAEREHTCEKEVSSEKKKKKKSPGCVVQSEHLETGQQKSLIFLEKGRP